MFNTDKFFWLVEYAAPGFRFLVSLAAVVLNGCCFHSDVTGTANVQGSELLGHQFQTTQRLDLLKDKRSGTLMLVAPEPPYKRIGVVEEGTELRVNRIVRITQLCAWMWFPVYWTWDCSLAKIESGPYAGKEIGVAGKGIIQIRPPTDRKKAVAGEGTNILWYVNEAATVGSAFLTNAPADH